jgi:MoxR-like ATPase
MTVFQSADPAPDFEPLIRQLESVLIGKRAPIVQAVSCLLAGGHLLIEDVPGVGKTTLAHALATSLGLGFSRVQFTSDLLPSDITGVSVYERGAERFVFHRGPIFAQVLLADEINRAGPKTQSALLEAMEERQVSVEGQTHPLPEPFFVVATQNPNEQLGTHPLPESQLDRFLMRISLGYPDVSAEQQLLMQGDKRQAALALPVLFDASAWKTWQNKVTSMHVSAHVVDYVQAILSASRNGHWFKQGLSPRAGLSLLRVAKALALLEGRDYVSPHEVQRCAVSALAHRLQPASGSGRNTATQVLAMLESLSVR